MFIDLETRLDIEAALVQILQENDILHYSQIWTLLQEQAPELAPKYASINNNTGFRRMLSMSDQFEIVWSPRGSWRLSAAKGT
jgi:hypothetical protein